MIMLSRGKIAIFALTVAVLATQNASAPFATIADAKTAVAAAVAASGPVGVFVAMPQVDPAPVNTAITNLKAVQAQYASSTDPKVIAALKDLTDTCVTPWTQAIAAIPNMNAEKTSLATAQTTIMTAITALESSMALAAIAKAKTDATAAVAALVTPTTGAIAKAAAALTAAKNAFNAIVADPLFTTGGATAPAMPWGSASGAAPATGGGTTSGTTGGTTSGTTGGTTGGTTTGS